MAALHTARLPGLPPLTGGLVGYLGYDVVRRLERLPTLAEDDLDLPELADVADVMQLDETGAALSGTLRARVRELRDAHLTAEQIRSSADAEGMTIYMTLPAMAFGLILLTAALLQIVLG